MLSGLLYFHRISDNRMAGTPLKNLRMFEELCGRNAFQNVILTTTMWDEVDEQMGVERERELKALYWRTMLDRGSTTHRFLRTRESAFDLINPLIEAVDKKNSVLLQDELVNMRKSLPATAAGLELYSAMGQLVSRREDLLRRIRYEMRRSNDDKMALEPLQEEHQNLQKSLEATVSEMLRLRLPFGQRLLIITDKFFSSKFESLLRSSIIKKSRNLSKSESAQAIDSPSFDSSSHPSAPHDPSMGQIDIPPGSTPHHDTPSPTPNGDQGIPSGQAYPNNDNEPPPTPSPVAARHGEDFQVQAQPIRNQNSSDTNRSTSKPTKPKEKPSQANDLSPSTTMEHAQNNPMSSDQGIHSGQTYQNNVVELPPTP